MKNLTILACVFLCSAVACTSDESRPEDSSAQKETVPADEHVWKAQTDALDKAKNVEKLIEDADKARLEQLDDETPD